MDIDPAALDRRAAYQVLISCVVPRPIALVTTVSKNGEVDAGPYSFFNVASTSPLLLSIAVTPPRAGRKDTRSNVEETGEFVANIVTPDMTDGMLACAVDPPPGLRKIDVAKFTTAPGVRVKVPRIVESPVSLECVLSQVVALEGGGALIVGRVVHIHAQDGAVSDGRVDPQKVRFLAALHGSSYMKTDAGFERRLK